MREARLYKTAQGARAECLLCSHRCNIADGKFGICGVRENIGGTLYTHVYGKLIAAHIDPIEKKPLFNFLPGSRSYSIAAPGCNFRCLHCQNSDISQMPRDKKRIIGEDTDPSEVASRAQESACESISYTYTEPTIFFEYAMDTAALAREKGLKNVFVTNGFMTKECLDEAKGLVDAANVDIKGFTESFYKKVCGARLAPVLENIEYMRALGIWVEITTLVIPGYNDSDDELKNIAKWIFKTDKAMPWHISAFHPAYKLTDAPPTPAKTLERASAIGLSAGLKYVYTGNIAGLSSESTYCPGCKKLLIERYVFTIKKNVVKDSKCPYCSVVIDGVWL
jgi:pyruvate formate lyase activating enzyme